MSKQNRSNRPFRTLGQRMLSFGRDIMRTYPNEAPNLSETETSASRPQGAMAFDDR